jgi:CRISPR-associated protein Cmr1
MHLLNYQVSFASPAFLGNAEQQAQWRTPPFKALIRQWWRVIKAREFGYDHRTLREAEMRLFGAASDEGEAKSHRSLVRLRLSSWADGRLANVPRGDMVDHDEVPSKQVGANLYLGYGPIGGVARNAISPVESTNQFSVRCPDDAVAEIKSAMQLAAWFGTLGSRSRNGWGALHIEGEGIKGFTSLNVPTLNTLISPRALDDCLKVEWLHALGCDAGSIPYVWRLLKIDKANKQLVPFQTWQEVMRELARIKIAVRTSDYFKFIGGGRDGHANPQPRHILSYPAGSQHAVGTWGNNGRLANQMLFKVHRHRDGVAATIAHFPSRLPTHMAARLQLPDQGAVWKEVHRLLDTMKPTDAGHLSRIKGAQA